MKTEDKDRVVRLFRPSLGRKDNARRRLFEFLIRDEVINSARAFTEAEILFQIDPQRSYSTVEDAQDAITAGETSHVRKAAGELRLLVQMFAKSTDGQRLPIGMRFPAGEYRIEFFKKDVHVSRFWQPYLDLEGSRSTLLVYPESVFFRSVSGRYLVRHLDLNELNADPRSKLWFLPESDLPLQPSRQFVVSGNAGTLLYLTRWFERKEVRTDHAVAHQSSAQFLAQKNLIILGTKRTVPFIERLSQGFNFEVEATGIVNRMPVDSDPIANGPEKSRSFYADDLRAPGTVRGLLLRTFDKRLGSWVTIISSNNGRFHEALAHYLTEEQQIEPLLTALSGSAEGPLPSRFEALLEADIEQFEDNPRPSFRLELLATRRYSE